MGVRLLVERTYRIIATQNRWRRRTRIIRVTVVYVCVACTRRCPHLSSYSRDSSGCGLLRIFCRSLFFSIFLVSSFRLSSLLKIAPSFTTQLLDKLLLRRINALSLTLIKTPRVGDRNTLLLYILMCSLKVDGGMDWGFCSSTRQTLLGRQSNKFSLKNEEMF